MHELRGKGNPAHWDTIALKAHCTLKYMWVFYHNIEILEMGLVVLQIKKKSSGQVLATNSGEM